LPLVSGSSLLDPLNLKAVLHEDTSQIGHSSVRSLDQILLAQCLAETLRCPRSNSPSYLVLQWLNRNMDPAHPSLELDAISRNLPDNSVELAKGILIQSVHSQSQNLLRESDSNHTGNWPIEHGQTVSPFPQRRRRRKWRSIANHCNACCWVSSVLTALIILPLFVVSYGYSGGDVPTFGFCQPNGNFNTGLEPISAWSPSAAFQITLGFGSMSFSTAKFIDVIWDVVGRQNGSVVMVLLTAYRLSAVVSKDY
jgi:hypothetical protein